MERVCYPHPCEGCEYFGPKDSGYGPYERHESYCFLHNLWRPDGCKDKRDE